MIAVAAVALVAVALPARAGGVKISINFGLPVVFAPPVVVAPAPPCLPPPVVYRVAPVYAPPVVVCPPYAPPVYRVAYFPPHPGWGHNQRHDNRGWVREEHGRGPGGPGHHR